MLVAVFFKAGWLVIPFSFVLMMLPPGYLVLAFRPEAAFGALLPHPLQCLSVLKVGRGFAPLLVPRVPYVPRVPLVPFVPLQAGSLSG